MDKLVIKLMFDELNLSNRVSYAYSVQNAVDQVVASQEDQATKFAMVIFDANNSIQQDLEVISDANGFKKTLRQSGFSEQRPKLVLLGGEAMKQKKTQQRNRETRPEFDYMLTKPINKEDLAKMLQLFRFNF